MNPAPRLRRFLSGFGLSLGLLLAGCSNESPVPRSNSRQMIPGTSRPDVSAFRFQNLDGHETRLADLKGKVVVVEFWATWCGPCRKSLPGLALLQKAASRDGRPLAVIPIHTDEDGWASVGPFLRQSGLLEAGFRSFSADPAAISASFGTIRGIPQTFLIDGEGRLSCRLEGYIEGELDERVRELSRELPRS